MLDNHEIVYSGQASHKWLLGPMLEMVLGMTMSLRRMAACMYAPRGVDDGRRMKWTKDILIIIVLIKYHCILINMCVFNSL